MLTPEQTENMKGQIISQIEKTFPDDKKAPAIQQIQAMDSEQLEHFLKQNKLIPTPETSGTPQGCVFCSIVSGEIPSHKIGENSKAIAVLEINPVSKGHSLVIPKEHISSADNMPAHATSLAKNIAKKIKTKLKPKKITISSSNLFGHEITNIIPIYGDEEPQERTQAKPEELEELANILSSTKKQSKQRIIKPKPKKLSEKLWLPKRIP